MHIENCKKIAKIYDCNTILTIRTKKSNPHIKHSKIRVFYIISG